MPRFFFDTYDGLTAMPDDVGLELATVDEARKAALEALPDMAHDSLPEHPIAEMSVQVRDEHGDVVFSAALVLILQEGAEPVHPWPAVGVSSSISSDGR